MRFSLRLMLPVIACIALISGLFAYYQEQDQEQALHKELDQRASLAALSLADNLQPLLDRNASATELRRALNRFSVRERIVGAAIFDDTGKSVAVTDRIPAALENAFPALTPKVDPENPEGHGLFLTLGARYYHAHTLSMHRADGKAMGLAVFHDAGFIREQSAVIWRQTLIHVSLEVLLIVLITFLVIRWSLVSPITKAAQWLKALRSGKPGDIAVPRSELLGPLAKEMEGVVKSLQEARAAAEREANLRETAESLWTSDRLSVHVRRRLQQRRLVVVSNREPYIHTRQNGNLEIMIPASGLVTAIEPILRSCDGTWIAEASGDADRETVDEHDRLRVPPAEPQYTLRRVWLNKEEENGYYFGFANEGLWPLCHIAHTRPIFRSENFEYYQQVNRKFADAVLEEIADTQKPFILVQDYHFALLPRMIKNERPDARVAIFWHIPWPNAEAFGICPWERELVDGLLGADLVGFHIQNHCNNFLETVDHAVECRIEWESLTVNRGGQLTRVRPFPISIDFTDGRDTESRESPYVDRAALLAGVGVQAKFMGVGVDRVDYTKGILERFRGIERFLEKYPYYQGKFTFVQIGAPSRMQIKRYLELYADVEAEANRINRRFTTNLWKPIVLLKRHHSHQEIERFYRASDLCLVTSLHDGMNLVAKEYVAARDDERGVLILSRFAGASRELHDALIVNPYDTEVIADAIHTALEMAPAEIERRMQTLRRTVREHNIYRWAANLISELAEIRLAPPQLPAARKASGATPPATPPVEIDATSL
jgi:alpha,alpha-trehalose-phosphate synthase [UDP-forming]